MSTEWLPPPRKVPFNIMVLCLLGGLRYQVSWFFLVFSTVFFLVFVFDYSSILLDRGKTETTTGTLLHREKTIFSTATFSLQSGFLHDQGEKIYQYFYRYKVGGTSFKARSYGTDRQHNGEITLVVEYLQNRPSLSRIQGMSSGIHLRSGVLPVVLVLVIILVAFSTVFAFTRKRIRWYQLLKGGMTATGVVKSKHLLSRSSGREWYEVEYEFVAGGRYYQVRTRPYYTRQVEVGEQQTVFHDRKNPDKADLLDNIPCAVTLDESGQIRPGSFLSAVAVSVVPITAILLMITAVYFELFK